MILIREVNQMSNPIIKVYLAGDVSKERWRLRVIKECQDLPIQFLSPIDDISYSYQSLCSVHKVNMVFEFVDKLKIKMCDILFAYLKEDSPSFFSGTSWEMGYAHALDKHIILVNDMKPSKECKYELVKRMANFYCKSLDEGIDHLREFVLELMFLPKEKSND